MGRHAQANRRGSATQGYTQSPPTNADWAIANDDSHIDASSLNAGPGGGVTAMEFIAYHAADPAHPFEQWSTPLLNEADSAGVWDEMMGVRSRWLIGTTPVSGWSAEKTLDFP